MIGQFTVQSQDLELNPSVLSISSLQISMWGLKTCEYKWILYETDFVLKSSVVVCRGKPPPSQNGVKLNPTCVYQHRCLSMQRRAFTYFGCFGFVSAAACLIVSAAPRKVCFSSVFSPKQRPQITHTNDLMDWSFNYMSWNFPKSHIRQAHLLCLEWIGHFIQSSNVHVFVKAGSSN